MTHLTAGEFVDLVEGRLDETRAAHTRTCPTCAGKAADVRDALSALELREVPEPPAAFWDALPARIRSAVEELPAPERQWWRRPALALGCAVVIMVSALFIHGGRLAPPDNTSALARPLPPSAGGGIAAATADTDAAWEFLADAAEGVSDDGAGDGVLTVSPQAVDQAVLQLTPAERDELGRLLERELHRSGA